MSAIAIPQPKAPALRFSAPTRAAVSPEPDVDVLVAEHMPLARRLAWRYARSSEPLDDLVQVACLGLVKAARGFDPSRGNAFSTYAVPTILGELKRHFRDHSWAVHVTRSEQERAMKIEAVSKQLADQLGRSPSVPELAEAANCTEEDVLQALQTGRAFSATSLDQPRRDDGAEDGETLRDTLRADERGYEMVEYGASIAPALRDLSERDRLALHLRFVEDKTQTEIAARLGVSQMQVSRILASCVALLSDAAQVEA